MQLRLLAFGISIFAFVPLAHADYGWCTIQRDGTYDTYISAVVDIGTTPDAHRAVLTERFGREFQTYVGQLETVVREPDCHSSKRLSDAEDMNRRYATSVGEEIRTNWRGGWPAPSESGATSAAGPHLTVKDDASAKQAPDRIRDAVLRAQRDEAAARAKQIANTARQRADMQGKLDKFFEEMRKRGRAQ